MTKPNELRALSETSVLLGQIWVRELDQKQADALKNEAISKLLGPLGCDLTDLATGDAIETLAIDYCQILVGPANAISPFQSVHEEGRFHGEAFASSQKFHALVGDVPDDCIEMPDHFATQLLFFARLLEIAGSEQKEAAEAGEVVRAFHHRHLRWTAKVLESIAGKAQTGFYESLAHVTRSFVIEATGIA